MRFFTVALRFEVDGSLAPSPPASLKHLFTHARRSTGGRSGSCSDRIGLRGNNDRGRSDRGHDTHNAYL